MSLARAVISGTVTSEPEKRFTPEQNVAVTSFTLSVPMPTRGNQPAQEPAPVKITCWRAMADAAEQLHRGDVVAIEGRLMMDAYQATDGSQRKGFELEASQITRLNGEPVALAVSGDSMGTSQSQQRSTPDTAGGYASAPAGNTPGIANDLTEDDIPF